MTCDAFVEAHVWPAKDPGDKLDYPVNFERHLARQWEKWTDFTTGQKIRVYLNGQASGFEFEATTGGRTSGRAPTWPTTISATVADGSVTWTCRALSADSLKATISGVPTWTADTGITVSNQTIIGNRAIAYLADGTDGEDYTVLVKATMTDGTSITAVCILPVRRAVRICA
jgi:hypothetical protein